MGVHSVGREREERKEKLGGEKFGAKGIKKTNMMLIAP